jgi:hypothetical protein
MWRGERGGCVDWSRSYGLEFELAGLGWNGYDMGR